MMTTDTTQASTARPALDGKKVLLTGASRGIGKKSAELLLRQGADVLGVARDDTRLSQAERELQGVGPGAFTALCLDITAPAAAARLCERIETLFGRLDVAIFNAAVMLHHEGGILSEPEGILERTMEVNVMAPHRLARALLPLLERAKEPRIINVGSGAGTLHLMRDDGIAAYRLSKWTLHGLTMLQAKELEGKVCVNAFDPGWIQTDLGGPKAPGTPQQAAEGLLATLSSQWSQSGKFYKDGQEIPW